MNVISRFVRFLIDFVIGDDWRVAAGVVVALAATALVARGADDPDGAWVIAPAAVVVVLALSLRPGR